MVCEKLLWNEEVEMECKSNSEFSGLCKFVSVVVPNCVYSLINTSQICQICPIIAVYRVDH